MHEDELFEYIFDDAVRTNEIVTASLRADTTDHELWQVAARDQNQIMRTAGAERTSIDVLLAERDQIGLALWHEYQSQPSRVVTSGRLSWVWDVIDPTRQYRSRAGDWPQPREMGPLLDALAKPVAAAARLLERIAQWSEERESQEAADRLRLVASRVAALASEIPQVAASPSSTTALLRTGPVLTSVTALTLFLVSVMLNAAAIVRAAFILLWIMTAGLVIAEWFMFRDQRVLLLANQVERDTRMADVRQRIEAADLALRSAVLQKGMLPYLREELNRNLGEVYGIELDGDTASTPGLHQVPESAYLISTRASRKVERLIDLMGGSGSIGISGPRGAGKSTLIDMICKDDEAARVVAVKVDAPVEYSSRDFLLHLFAETCRKVRGPVVPDAQSTDWPEMAAGRMRRVKPYVVSALTVAAVFSIVFGIVLAARPDLPIPKGIRGVVWLWSGSVSVQHGVWTLGVVPDAALIAGMLILGNRSLGLLGDGLRVAGFFGVFLAIEFILQKAIPALLPDANRLRFEVIRPLLRALLTQLGLPRAMEQTALHAVHGFVTAIDWMGVPPVFAVLAAAAALVPGLRRRLVYPTFGYRWLGRYESPWPVRVEVLTGILLIVLGLTPRLAIDLSRSSTAYVVAGVAIAAVGVVVRTAVELSKSDAWERHVVADAVEAHRTLYRLASQQLDQIRYQLSHTAGWSATFKMSGPMALETGMTRSRSRTANPTSLPDLVAEFRTFVQMALSMGADHYQTGHPWHRAPGANRLIIGIDELDKIESEEKAHQFINDIKAVFRIPGTCYLVSVSEDAMASFERRGMPIRDAFDSALDDIVRVAYLDYDDACLFMRSRVIGMPRPFLGLAFVNSGGLARDLIRTTRHIYELSRRFTTLGDITAELVGSEMASKSTAVMKQITATEPYIAAVSHWCTQAAMCGADHGRLIRHSCELADVLTAAHKMDSQISILLSELAAYEYYCATVLELFCEYEDDRFKCAESVGSGTLSLNQLASARQAFAINSPLAWERVSAFRTAWGLQAGDYPRA